MARPVKRRRVCGLPPVGAFRPEGGPGGPVIEVTVDEYEAVRRRAGPWQSRGALTTCAVRRSTAAAGAAAAGAGEGAGAKTAA